MEYQKCLDYAIKFIWIRKLLEWVWTANDIQAHKCAADTQQQLFANHCLLTACIISHTYHLRPVTRSLTGLITTHHWSSSRTIFRFSEACHIFAINQFFLCTITTRWSTAYTCIWLYRVKPVTFLQSINFSSVPLQRGEVRRILVFDPIEYLIKEHVGIRTISTMNTRFLLHKVVRLLKEKLKILPSKYSIYTVTSYCKDLYSTKVFSGFNVDAPFVWAQSVTTEA